MKQKTTQRNAAKGYMMNRMINAERKLTADIAFKGDMVKES